jgi:ADP-ribose pyrophosphatase YjhB (NUDIX family)
MSHILWISTLIVDHDRVLLVHEKKETHYNKINLPGGHLELGETVIEWAKREAREEVQSEIELDGLLTIYSGKETHIGQEKSTQHFIFLWHIIDWSGQPNTEEVLDAKWYTFEELEKMPDILFLKASKIHESIAKYRSGQIASINTIIEVSK